MPIEKEAVLREIDAVRNEVTGIEGGGFQAIFKATTLQTAALARYAPPDSTYARQVAAVTSDERAMRQGYAIEMLDGILQALRNDVAGDRLRSFGEIVHAAVFADLLGAAEHFVESGYLMPAAVMAGGTLEEHLRQLATKHAIPTMIRRPNGRTKPKEASALNDELCAQANVYLQTEQAQNQAWLQIRNMAAHNKPEFAQVTEPQVTAMIEGVRNFISRHPA